MFMFIIFVYFVFPTMIFSVDDASSIENVRHVISMFDLDSVRDLANTDFTGVSAASISIDHPLNQPLADAYCVLSILSCLPERCLASGKDGVKRAFTILSRQEEIDTGNGAGGTILSLIEQIGCALLAFESNRLSHTSEIVNSNCGKNPCVLGYSFGKVDVIKRDLMKCVKEWVSYGVLPLTRVLNSAVMQMCWRLLTPSSSPSSTAELSAASDLVCELIEQSVKPDHMISILKADESVANRGSGNGNTDGHADVKDMRTHKNGGKNGKRKGRYRNKGKGGGSGDASNLDADTVLSNCNNDFNVHLIQTLLGHVCSLEGALLDAETSTPHSRHLPQTDCHSSMSSSSQRSRLSFYIVCIVTRAVEVNFPFITEFFFPMQRKALSPSTPFSSSPLVAPLSSMPVSYCASLQALLLNEGWMSLLSFLLRCTKHYDISIAIITYECWLKFTTASFKNNVLGNSLELEAQQRQLQNLEQSIIDAGGSVSNASLHAGLHERVVGVLSLHASFRELMLSVIPAVILQCQYRGDYKHMPEDYMIEFNSFRNESRRVMRALVGLSSIGSTADSSKKTGEMLDVVEVIRAFESTGGQPDVPSSPPLRYTLSIFSDIIVHLFEQGCVQLQSPESPSLLPWAMGECAVHAFSAISKSLLIDAESNNSHQSLLVRVLGEDGLMFQLLSSSAAVSVPAVVGGEGGGGVGATSSLSSPSSSSASSSAPSRLHSGLWCTAMVAVGVYATWLTQRANILPQAFNLLIASLNIPQEHDIFPMRTKQDHVGVIALYKLCTALSTAVQQLHAPPGSPTALELARLRRGDNGEYRAGCSTALPAVLYVLDYSFFLHFCSKIHSISVQSHNEISRVHADSAKDGTEFSSTTGNAGKIASATVNIQCASRAFLYESMGILLYVKSLISSVDFDQCVQERQELSHLVFDSMRERISVAASEFSTLSTVVREQLGLNYSLIQQIQDSLQGMAKGLLAGRDFCSDGEVAVVVASIEMKMKEAHSALLECQPRHSALRSSVAKLTDLITCLGSLVFGLGNNNNMSKHNIGIVTYDDEKKGHHIFHNLVAIIRSDAFPAIVLEVSKYIAVFNDELHDYHFGLSLLVRQLESEMEAFQQYHHNHQNQRHLQTVARLQQMQLRILHECIEMSREMEKESNENYKCVLKAICDLMENSFRSVSKFNHCYAMPSVLKIIDASQTRISLVSATAKAAASAADFTDSSSEPSLFERLLSLLNAFAENILQQKRRDVVTDSRLLSICATFVEEFYLTSDPHTKLSTNSAHADIIHDCGDIAVLTKEPNLVSFQQLVGSFCRMVLAQERPLTNFSKVSLYSPHQTSRTFYPNANANDTAFSGKIRHDNFHTHPNDSSVIDDPALFSFPLSAYPIPPTRLDIDLITSLFNLLVTVGDRYPHIFLATIEVSAPGTAVGENSTVTIILLEYLLQWCFQCGLALQERGPARAVLSFLTKLPTWHALGTQYSQPPQSKRKRHLQLRVPVRRLAGVGSNQLHHPRTSVLSDSQWSARKWGEDKCRCLSFCVFSQTFLQLLGVDTPHALAGSASAHFLLKGLLWAAAGRMQCNVFDDVISALWSLHLNLERGVFMTWLSFVLNSDVSNVPFRRSGIAGNNGSPIVGSNTSQNSNISRNRLAQQELLKMLTKANQRHLSSVLESKHIDSDSDSDANEIECPDHSLELCRQIKWLAKFPGYRAQFKAAIKASCMKKSKK